MERQTSFRFGLDFGTTNSAMVCHLSSGERNEFVPIADDEGRPIPSVVAINRMTGEIFTGRNTWDRRIELSQTCAFFSSIKTLLDADKNHHIAGKDWTPEDIAVELLRYLKGEAERKTNNMVSSVVMSIPIGFSARKRRILRKAAHRAGMTVDSFISEPTAAVFANYDKIRGESIVAVFDWGGGTLDVSILEITNGHIYERATSGMNVAGDVLDQKIAEKLHARISRKKGISIAFHDMNPIDQDKMIVSAERAKRALCDDELATIVINSYGEYGAIRETLDYDWFSEIIEPEINKALGCLKDTIEESGVGVSNIDRIIMIGGSSNLRPLNEKLADKYGDKILYPLVTMWNVGEGAAMLAANPGRYRSFQDIGILMSDGALFPLLKTSEYVKGWSKKCSFGIVDSTEEARFVFGGSADIEGSEDKYHSLILPAYRFLEERINVQAVVDDDLVFHVSVKSNMQPSAYDRIWTYERLKCIYDLPKNRKRSEHDE